MVKGAHYSSAEWGLLPSSSIRWLTTTYNSSSRNLMPSSGLYRYLHTHSIPPRGEGGRQGESEIGVGVGRENLKTVA